MCMIPSRFGLKASLMNLFEKRPPDLLEARMESPGW